MMFAMTATRYLQEHGFDPFEPCDALNLRLDGMRLPESDVEEALRAICTLCQQQKASKKQNDSHDLLRFSASHCKLLLRVSKLDAWSFTFETNGAGAPLRIINSECRKGLLHRIFWRSSYPYIVYIGKEHGNGSEIKKTVKFWIMMKGISPPNVAGFSTIAQQPSPSTPWDIYFRTLSMRQPG